MFVLSPDNWLIISKMSDVERVYSSLKGFIKNALIKNNVTQFSIADMTEPQLFGPKEHEEDGFLTVGETKSDRSTVKTSTFNSQRGVDAPPAYSQVSQSDQELPTYRTAIERGMSVSESPVSAPETCNSSLQPISGIAFSLAPVLALQSEISQSKLCSEDNLPRTFVWSKYNYDFSLERSYLQECSANSCDETQTDISLNGVDLIQL